MAYAIKEFHQLRPADYSVRTLIKAVTGRNGRDYTLHHVSRGYEVAGSCARFTEEKWSVTFTLGGCSHGRAFKTPQEAENALHRWANAE